MIKLLLLILILSKSKNKIINSNKNRIFARFNDITIDKKTVMLINTLTKIQNTSFIFIIFIINNLTY